MTKAIVIREKDVEKYLVHRCKEIGALCWKWVSPGVTGVPDRIVLWHGRVWFVELKSEGRKPTPNQQRIHNRMFKRGYFVYIIDSHESADSFVEEVLKACAF